MKVIIVGKKRGIKRKKKTIPNMLRW